MNRNKCILQVEDEEADVYLLRFAFEKAGINLNLQPVSDGERAIDYLAGNGQFSDRNQFPLPCLILLDLNLPRLSGLQVLEWIRSQPQLSRLVVLILSSSAQPGDLSRAYKLGANSFVQKPSGIDKTIEFAKRLKAWWLDFNQYAES